MGTSSGSGRWRQQQASPRVAPLGLLQHLCEGDHREKRVTCQVETRPADSRPEGAGAIGNAEAQQAPRVPLGRRREHQWPLSPSRVRSDERALRGPPPAAQPGVSPRSTRCEKLK
ncbi:hypothetical protein KFU94_57605 [Chloroflexi bacterium TSY]|nr:hypothetical protein [Chloroflexi bacterium TSY]